MHGNQALWTGNQGKDSFRGAISLELYNNTVTVSNGYRIVYLRGGRSLVYNNSFNFTNSTFPIVSPTEEEGYATTASPGPPYRTVWPAEDQVNNSFWWGNTVNGQAQVAGDFVNW